MNAFRYWEAPLRFLVRNSERLLTLEFLPYKIRKWVIRVFIAYNFGLMLLLLVNDQLHFLAQGVAYDIARPLIYFWTVFALYIVFVYLPSQTLLELYSYLKARNIPSSHAILISVFTIIGIVASLFIFRYL